MTLIVVDPLGDSRQDRIIRWELERRRLLARLAHVLEESPRAIESLKGTVNGSERLGRRVFAMRKLDKD